MCVCALGSQIGLLLLSHLPLCQLNATSNAGEVAVKMAITGVLTTRAKKSEMQNARGSNDNRPDAHVIAFSLCSPTQVWITQF